MTMLIIPLILYYRHNSVWRNWHYSSFQIPCEGKKLHTMLSDSLVSKKTHGININVRTSSFPENTEFVTFILSLSLWPKSFEVVCYVLETNGNTLKISSYLHLLENIAQPSILSPVVVNQAKIKEKKTMDLIDVTYEISWFFSSYMVLKVSCIVKASS